MMYQALWMFLDVVFFGCIRNYYLEVGMTYAEDICSAEYARMLYALQLHKNFTSF